MLRAICISGPTVYMIPAMERKYIVLELHFLCVSDVDCLCQKRFTLESEMSYLKTVKAFVNFTYTPNIQSVTFFLRTKSCCTILKHVTTIKSLLFVICMAGKWNDSLYIYILASRSFGSVNKNKFECRTTKNKFYVLLSK